MTERRGRAAPAVTIALVLIGAAAGASVFDDGASPVAAAAPNVMDLLGGVDFVPPRSTLDDSLGAGAVDQLIALARDDDGDTDPGLRLRAFRALAEYPGADTEGALLQAVADHADASAGIETLYLRAAAHSLAVVAGPSAVDPLRLILDHPVRDVRAATASAMAVTGAPEAVPHLRQQLVIETDAQVRIALSEAIRALTQPE